MPSVSPFAKKRMPKNPAKRSRTENHRDNRKQKRARKVEGGFPTPKKAMSIFTLTSMPVTKTTTTTTTATAPNLPAVPNQLAPAVTTPTAQFCEVCRIGAKPCPLFTKPVPSPFPQESDWLDEDWDGDRPRERKRRKGEQ